MTWKMPKLAQIIQPSQAVRGRFVFFPSLHKKNIFHAAVGLFSNESQKTSKCGKNIDDTLDCDSCHIALLNVF